MVEFREPNKEEKEDLIAYHTEELGKSRKEAEEMVDTYNFIVIDGYLPDSPGYKGKVIFALYGYVSAYEVYVYDDDGKLTRQPSEQESRGNKN